MMDVIHNLIRLFTVCLLLSSGVIASDSGPKEAQNQPRSAQMITLETVQEMNRVYKVACDACAKDDQDLARSSFEKMIQLPVYKQVRTRQLFFNDFEQFIPLYLYGAGKEKRLGRILVFHSYLHEPDILQHMERGRVYRLWDLAAADSVVLKDSENAQKIHSYFVFNDDLTTYFNEDQIFKTMKLAADQYPIESPKRFKLQQKTLSLNKFQDELKNHPIPTLFFCEKAFITSTLCADMNEQLRILRLYLFHPSMTEMLTESKLYIGTYTALDVLHSSKCHVEYTKAYELYYPALLKSNKFSPQELFNLTRRAAIHFNDQKKFQEAINLLLPLLKSHAPKTPDDLSDHLKAKTNLAFAYWNCDQKSQALTLFKEISFHPQLEAIQRHQVFSSTAMHYFAMNNDYDLVAQSAAITFLNLPAFIKAHSSDEASRILLMGLAGYFQMDEREKIHTLVKDLESKKTDILLHPLALGYHFLGNSELCIKYLEELSERSNDAPDDLFYSRIIMLAKEYFNLGKYDKSAKIFEKASEKLTLFDKSTLVITYMKAGSFKKARTLAMQIEALLENAEYLPILNINLLMAYAFSQSTVEADHDKSRALLRKASSLASSWVVLDENKLISNREYLFGLSLMKIAEQGEGIFEQLQKYCFEYFKINRFETEPVFSLGTSLPINLKKDILALHAGYTPKTKTTGVADPEKAVDASVHKSQNEIAVPQPPLPLLITSGVRSLLECFQSSDWKKVDAICWHHIETFFSPQQGRQGIVFTSHGGGTDHITYTIYQRGTDLNDAAEKPKNEMITLVNQGSRTASIKFYLKKKLRDILINMGYLTPDN